MPDPHIADKRPARLELEAGTYWWCACGLSKTQPWCDGSHKEKCEFSPVEVVIEEKRMASMCQCKFSANKPFCDGAHKAL